VCKWRLSVLVLNSFCDRCSPVTWRNLGMKNFSKVFFNIEKTPSEIYDMIKKSLPWRRHRYNTNFRRAFIHVSNVATFRWNFRSPIVKSREGNVEIMRQVIYEGRRRTIKDVCNIRVLSYGTSRRILTEDLNMPRKLCPVCWVTPEINPAFCMCKDLPDHANKDRNFLPKDIT
jgi:hypothetical protein